MTRFFCLLLLCLLLPAHAFTPSLIFAPSRSASRSRATSTHLPLAHTRTRTRTHAHTEVKAVERETSPNPEVENEEEVMLSAGRDAFRSPWSSSSEKDKFVASAMAFAAVAGSGLIAFVVEQGGTVIVVELLRRLTKASSLMQTVDILTAQAQAMGWVAIPIYTCGATFLQLAPVCNGLLMCMTMGVIFGTSTGIAIMSMSAVLSAVICLLNSRYLASSVFKDASSKAPPVFQAISNGISDSYQKTLVLVGLVRLSPVIPFCWSNYLFGLTPVPIFPYAVGTFLGTLPGLSVFVSAGVVGKAMATGSVSVPPALFASGIAATAAVMAILGKVSQKELAKLSVKEDDQKSQSGTEAANIV